MEEREKEHWSMKINEEPTCSTQIGEKQEVSGLKDHVAACFLPSKDQKEDGSTDRYGTCVNR